MNLLRRQIDKKYKQKYISPDKIVDFIHRDEITYIEFEEFIYFHYTFIKVIQLLRKDGKKIAVHIRKINNNIFSHDLVKESLSIWEDVDYVVLSQEDFSLRNSEQSLFSNTFFFGTDINAHSQELLERRRSYYHSSLKQVSLSYPKYSSLSSLKSMVNTYTNQKKKVGIVTGVFDVVHPGHIRFLREAKKHVDVLIVMINSDLSANHQPKNRDHDRPVHRLHERVGVLNGLSVIDHIIPFDADSAEKILTDLQEPIIYIKTVKDKERKSIQQEIAVVKASGGKAAFISNLRNKSGSIISSTMLIKACRQKAYKQDFKFDASWSPEVVQLLFTLINDLEKWDQIHGRISELREKLRGRYTGSLKTCVQIEQEVIDELLPLTQELIDWLPIKREYYSYLLPYILGKLLDLPVKIVPVQYPQQGLPYGMVNAVQRLGGNMVFFDSKKKKIYKPILFEENYWKVMPHHTHFLARNHRKMFAMRIYVYEQRIHNASLSVRILNEELTSIQERGKRELYKEELTRCFQTALAVLDDLPMPHQLPDVLSRAVDKEGSYKREYPGIVAHGGAAILSPKDPRAENSASGIRHALRVGVDIVEIDVSVCKDGWMVSHDRMLEIGTTAAGSITTKTVKELLQVPIKLANGQASSEKMITLAQALEIVAEERLGDSRPLYVKVDIKLSDSKLEKQFVQILKSCPLNLEKILVTTQLTATKRRLKAYCPELSFEFNTVESNLFVLAYQLIRSDVLLDIYTSSLVYYGQLDQARTISFAQFAISDFGQTFSQKVITALQILGFEVQAWVASSIDEYLSLAALGVNYVLIQDPTVISAALQIKKNNVDESEISNAASLLS